MAIDALNPDVPAEMNESELFDFFSVRVKEAIADTEATRKRLKKTLATGIQRPKVKSNKVESPILTSQQVRKMLDTPDTSTFKGLGDYLILHIFFYTGCRISEISSLKVQDFYEDGGYWVLNLKTKGGGRNRIAINPILGPH